jgi:predicted XRE-type DNA-binding protein
MATGTQVRAGDVFEGDVSADTRDPEARAFFEKEYAKAMAIGTLLQQLEAARDRKHLSKREVARRMHRKESAVSRLLKGEGANPTFDTITDLAYALDLEVEVRIKDRSPRSKKPRIPVRVLSAA